MTTQPHIHIPDIDITDSLEPGDARLLRGNPTEDELAAIAGTLAVMFEEGVQVDRPRDRNHKRSGWQQSQRALRGGETPYQVLFGDYR